MHPHPPSPPPSPPPPSNLPLSPLLQRLKIYSYEGFHVAMTYYKLIVVLIS